MEGMEIEEKDLGAWICKTAAIQTNVALRQIQRAFNYHKKRILSHYTKHCWPKIGLKHRHLVPMARKQHPSALEITKKRGATDI